MNYEIKQERYGAHIALDAALDMAEREKFLEGRASAINELMPHTIQFQKAAKKSQKKNPPGLGRTPEEADQAAILDGSMIKPMQ